MNNSKAPRISFKREKNSYSIDKYYIVSLNKVWQSYEPTESLLSIIIHLYAYYFLLNISYTTSFEVILGFFHEALEIKTPVYFTIKKSVKYLNNLKELSSEVAKYRNKIL